MKAKKTTQQKDQNIPQLLTVKELCAKVRVSKDWVYKRTREGAIDPLPFIRLGRSLRFDQEKIEEYIHERQKVDAGGILSATDGIVRVNGRRYQSMTRKRFQKGHVRLRGGKNPYWEGHYREDILLPDGQVVRKQRTANLGRKKDVSTKKLAERKLAKIIAEINDEEYRPRAILTVKQFVENHYRKLVLPLKKATTQHGYNVALNKHILPRFGDKQVSEVTKETIQVFILEKQDDGLAWNTLANLRAVLGAVFTSAVEASIRKSSPVRGAKLPPEPHRELAELPSDRDLDRLEREIPKPTPC